VQKTLHKKVYSSDKIIEVVNDSDSDGGNCSELSDSDMCEVNSPFSSSSSNKDEVVQTEPDRGRRRTLRALPKCAETDFALGWKEKIQMVQ
jgi:hypothetical protein